MSDSEITIHNQYKAKCDTACITLIEYGELKKSKENGKVGVVRQTYHANVCQVLIEVVNRMLKEGMTNLPDDKAFLEHAKEVVKLVDEMKASIMKLKA